MTIFQQDALGQKVEMTTLVNEATKTMSRKNLRALTRWRPAQTICFLLLTFFSCQSPAAAEGVPLQEASEVMTYKIRWSFVPAGQAVLAATTESEAELNQGNLLRHFSLAVKTYPALDLLYKYWERIDSYTNLAIEHSLLYKKWQTGKSERDIVVEFNWATRQAQYSNFGSPLPPIALVPGTLDPLSALYFIRQQPLAEGLIIERPITDGKKTVTGNVKVLKRETIRIDGKAYDTFKLEPELNEVKGVFEKSRNAKMHIWITADENRVVVKLKSKVIIGSFVAELSDYRHNVPLGEERSNSAASAAVIERRAPPQGQIGTIDHGLI